MRSKLLCAAVLASTLALTSGLALAEKITIGATEVPHAEILAVVKPMLAKDGITLDVKVFSDYVQPNLQLADKQLDANFFQHKPYLNTFNKDRKTQLTVVAAVHIEPFGAYSKKIKKLSELKDGATIAIPNDPSNGGRALLLLQQQGLLKLKDVNNILATPLDIAENPRRFKFRALEAPMLPRSLDDVGMALINTNYALEAGLQPTKDALFIEGADSPYVNVVVARADNHQSAAMQKLAKALHSDAVRDFIKTKYKGAVVPAF